MTRTQRCALCLLLLAGIVPGLLTGRMPRAQAQVVLDGTLGHAGALAGPSFVIPANLGRQFGPDLFHSFGEFNMNSKQSATFTGPNSVANILARVTGGRSSSLDGLLASPIPGVNFYFINPQGVVFGPHARVQVGGSFAATTADVVRLGAGGVFDARPSAAIILTSAPPTAFGFLNSRPAAIQIDGSTLSVKAGHTLSLIGGDLQMNGGSVGVRSGQINLVSLHSSGQVGLHGELSGTGPGGNIRLTNAAFVDTANGGKVLVRGGSLFSDSGVVAIVNRGSSVGGTIDIAIQGDMLLNTENAGVVAVGLSTGRAADIQVQAGHVVLENGATIQNGTQSSGATGSVRISARRLDILSGANVGSDTFAGGAGGNVMVQADEIYLNGHGATGFTGIGAQTHAASGGGKGGDVSIETQELDLTDGGAVSTSSYGSGHGGNLTMHARNIEVDGRGAPDQFTGVLADTSGKEGGGAGGSIVIDTHNLDLRHNGVISSDTLGSGGGGNITIHAQSVHITGPGNQNLTTGISATTEDQSHGGQGGAITLQATNLQVLQGGRITATTSGSGNAGNITISSDGVHLDGQGATALTGISADTQARSGGKGGDIAIDANALEIKNQGTVQVSTFGSGHGGNITIQARSLRVDGRGAPANQLTGIGADTQSLSGGGTGGAISINAGALSLSGGGEIEAKTLGSGHGGNINVQADTILMDGQAAPTGENTAIVATTGDQSHGGQAGDVTIHARNIELSRGAAVGVATFGSGQGGDVSINTQDLGLEQGGEVSATAFATGNGGHITIRAGHIVIDGQGTRADQFAGIAANTQASHGGQGGNITLETQGLTMVHGGQIAANTLGSGHGGSINVHADTILMDGRGAGAGTITSISAQTESASGGGRGGDVVLATRNLSISDGAQVTASTFGHGDGGNVTVQARKISLDGKDNGSQTGIICDTHGSRGGRGGDITLQTQSLEALNGAQVAASSVGLGRAGDITIQADAIRLDTQGSARFTGIGTDTGSRGQGGQGGNIALHARSLEILHGAQVESNTFGLGQGGSITIQADDMRLDGQGPNTSSSIAAESANPGQGGKGGDLTIHAGTLTVLSGAEIASSTFGAGDGGTITIQGDTIQLDGHNANSFTGISAQTISSGRGGSAGNIRLEAKHLYVVGGAHITADTLGQGSGADITIQAGRIQLDGHSSSVTAETRSPGQGGKAGDITVQAQDLDIANTGLLSTQSLGGGRGGDIAIHADHVHLDGDGTRNFTGIDAETDSPLQGGAGGSIAVTVKDLEASKGAAINASTYGNGQGGSLTITAGHMILDGSGGGLGVVTGSPRHGGHGGDIIVQAGDLELRNGSTMTASTSGSGHGGSIQVAAGTVHLSGGADLECSSSGTGDAGSLRLRVARQLSLTSNSSVLTSAAQSNGGNISVTAGNGIQLDNSTISAQAGGDGGGIQLRAGEMVFLRNSQLSAKAGDTGGNISIDPRFVILDKSRITADAIRGNGGNISIRSQVFLPSIESVVSASSQFGVAGNIRVDSPNTGVGGSLVRLQANPLGAENYLQERCSIRRRLKSSSFTVGGNGGVPPQPAGLLPSVDVR